MLAQDVYGLLYASAGYVLVVGFLALVMALIVQRARLRTWKRAHGLIRGDYRDLLASHAKLRAERDGAALTDTDRALLEGLAQELRGAVVSFDGDVLLDDAEGVTVATIPVPVVEIEYPDRLVTLRLEVEHYSAEEEVTA